MIRVLAVLLVALLALAPRVAFAAAVNVPADLCTFANKCPQGSAYSSCMSYASQAVSVLIQSGITSNGSLYAGAYAWCPSVDGAYQARAAGAPGGSFWNLTSYMNRVEFYFDTTKSCASQPALQNVRVQGNAGACSGGCGFAVDTSGTWDVVTVGGVTITKASKMSPTGQACTVGDGVGGPSSPLGDQERCVQTGTLTQCVRADGKTCATASTGKQFCWSPGESGVKTAESGNQAATKSPEGAQINAPKDPPANGGDWSVSGQGQVTSSSNGGASTTSNITTFDSTYGKDGTGKGDGTGSGSGSGGSGDGGDDGDDDDPGAGAERSKLYTKSEKTVSSVLDQFMGSVQQTRIVGGISTFMTLPGGGSCPVFSIPGTKWWSAMNYSGHCSGDFLVFLQACGFVILAIAAYFAIRIAVT